MNKENFNQLLITIALIITGAIGYKMTSRPKPVIIERTKFVQRDSLTKENLKYWIEVARIKSPEIVYKQAMIESGNLNCEGCSLDSNNLFGFSNGKRHLYFSHWIESVFYYSWWQGKNYKGGDYYLFLKDFKYAEDSNYINKLKQ